MQVVSMSVPAFEREPTPYDIAMALLQSRFTGKFPNSTYTLPLLYAGQAGNFWVWDDNRWSYRDRNWVKFAAWQALNETQYPTTTARGIFWQRLSVSSHEMSSILDILSSASPWPLPDGETRGHLLTFDDPDDLLDLDTCIAFEDCIIDVTTPDPKTIFRTYPRLPHYFISATIPLKWQDCINAPCPTWERSMQQWSNNDSRWIECRERLYGYSLLGTRKFATAAIEYGKPRSGKGIATNAVLRRLLPGPLYCGTTVPSFIDKYGLSNARYAQAIVISEAEGSRAEFVRLSPILKSILGRDTVDTNAKYVAPRQSIMPGFVILQCNQLPPISDVSNSLMPKIIPLYFSQSFVGKEDVGLDAALATELHGIARRLALAASRLLTEGHFSPPTTSLALRRDIARDANPAQTFLEDNFEPATPDDFVTIDTLQRIRERWEASNDSQIETSSGKPVSHARLIRVLIERTTWPLTQSRAQENGIRSQRLHGLRPRDPRKETTP